MVLGLEVILSDDVVWETGGRSEEIGGEDLRDTGSEEVAIERKTSS